MNFFSGLVALIIWVAFGTLLLAGALWGLGVENPGFLRLSVATFFFQLFFSFLNWAGIKNNAKPVMRK